MQIIALMPVCKAVSQLLPGMVEVVLHDLSTGKIAALEGGFSKRQVGDNSLVDTENYAGEVKTDGTIGPYLKSNSDGSRIKSVSALIPDDDGQPLALLCVNMRTDELEAAKALLTALTERPSQSNRQILKNDWREMANSIIAATLKELKVPFSQIRREQRVEILQRLYQADLLSIRGAGGYVAEALGVSRASFYAMLRDVKSNDGER